MVKTTEKAKFSHTSNAQKLAMLNWLENQKNFKWITGSLAQDSSMTSGQKLKKIDAYQAITSHVNKITKSSWDSKTGSSRYESFINQYKKTVSESQGTGWGVTEADIKKGITTVEEKLENKCPYFRRLDNLFGERQNINPSSVLTTDTPEKKIEVDSFQTVIEDTPGPSTQLNFPVYYDDLVQET